MMIEIALMIWFALTALSVIYVAWDAQTRNPELGVMKLGWVLVTLYAGPVAAALYILSCKEPARGTHEVFIKPLWKQSLGSTIHCMAGDATGIILAAAVTTTLGLPMWLDVIVEYVFGFAFGLLVFQALFMRTMLGGSYVTAVRRSFNPEWLSMNAVMAGMIPVMVALMASDMKAMDPTSMRFWGTMSLATLVGGVIAYPVNVWLVAAGLKHGMGTVRVLGSGGHAMHIDPAILASAVTTTDAPGPDRAAMPGMPEMQRLSKDTQPEMNMDRSGTSRLEIAAVAVLTLVALGGGIVIAERSGGFAPKSLEMPHGAMPSM